MQGWGDVGFNLEGRTGKQWDTQAHTPFLDRMAAQGVIFTDFHTASPVCSPSRVGFMSGRVPARFSIHTALNVHWAANAAEGQANFLDPSTPTVTRLLQDAGWRTGHFGKCVHHASGATLPPSVWRSCMLSSPFTRPAHACTLLLCAQVASGVGRQRGCVAAGAVAGERQCVRRAATHLRCQPAMATQSVVYHHATAEMRRTPPCD
jgi:hypothetical protein